MAVVIYKTSGRQARWYVRDTTKDFHTQYGPIKKTKLKPCAFELSGEQFVVVDAEFLDDYKAMKRKAQIITRKDVGFLIGYCAVGKKSIVVEAGAGSGGATILLANVCKHVYSYEQREEYIELVKQNLQRCKLKNVTITHADFYKSRDVKKHDADLVLLDVPEPWRAFASVKKTLKKGGYVIVYTPTIIQAQRFAEELPKQFLHERTLELMDRDWKLQGQAVRPVNASIGHTGFMTFIRKVR